MSLVEKLIPQKEIYTIPEELFNVQEEKQVIVKGYVNQYSSRVRIFRNTFLFCNNTGKKYRLLNFYNITEHPVYTELRRHQAFTLVFEGLNKECTSFDLVEFILEPRAFEKYNVPRNNSDVYVMWF